MTKSRSKSRQSCVTYEEYADQDVYPRIQFCPCYRRKLRHGKEFNEQDARVFMDKHCELQQSHATARFSEDSFMLVRNNAKDKKPFRSWLGYSEIVDIQRSEKVENCIVLSVDSATSHEKYYEVYRCKTGEGAKEFENLVREAKENNNKLIRVPIPKEPSTMPLNRHRTISHFEVQTHLDSYDEDKRRSTVCQLMSPTPPDESNYEYEEPPIAVLQEEHKENYVLSAPAYSASSSPKFKDSASSPIVTRATPKIGASAPVVRALSSEVKTSSSPSVALLSELEPVVTTVEPTFEAVIEAPPPPEPMGSEGVTYIKFDPQTQYPSVSDNGPVYMLHYRNNYPDFMDGYGTGYQSNEHLRNGGRVSYEYAN